VVVLIVGCGVHGGSGEPGLPDTGTVPDTVTVAGGLSSGRGGSRGWSDIDVAPVAEPHYAGLVAVGCPSEDRCTALGSSQEGWYLQQWTGQATTRQRAPDPSVFPRDLACGDDTFCVVVGSRNGSRGAEAAILTGRDGRWALVTGAALGLGADALDAVACAGASFCVAAGTAGVARWDGHSWAVVSAERHIVSDLACVSVEWCLSDEGQRWDGRSWTTGGPIGREVQHHLVACSQKDRCVLSGTAFTGHEETTPVLVTVGGPGAWSTARPFGGGSRGHDDALACHGDRCLLVATPGVRQSDDGGAHWEPVEVPGGGRFGQVADLACRPRWCLAVGVRDQQPWSARFDFG
jgi:hypothetical protein